MPFFRDVRRDDLDDPHLNVLNQMLAEIARTLDNHAQALAQGGGTAAPAAPAPVGNAPSRSVVVQPGIPFSRRIDTTAPLTGGGDLTVDRTLAIDAFTGDAGIGGAKGAVPAPAAGDGVHKFLKADGGFRQAAAADLSDGTTGSSKVVLQQNPELTGYLDLDAIANPAAPAAGKVRHHAATMQGFTRLEQDNEAPTNVILGRDNVLIAKNTSGSPIAAGAPVYVTGSTGNVPTIGPTKADSLTTLPAIGVALDAIANNAFGQVMKLGVIQNINTNAWNTGDQLWVSPTSAGSLTNVRPTFATGYVQRIGSVLVKGVGNGSLLITTAPFIGHIDEMPLAYLDTDGTLAANSDAKVASQKAAKTYADTKVTANGAIVGATKTKLSYDAKGLVTSGTDATTADIADSTDKRYVTDAQQTLVGTLAASTYTPSLTNVANLDGSTAYACQYLRVGSVVTVSGRVAMDPTAGASTKLGIALPIASNLAAAQQCSGTAFSPQVAGLGAAILGDTVNHRAQLEFIAVDTSNRDFYFTFQYTVV